MTTATESPANDSRQLAGRAVRGGAVLMACRLLVQVFVWTVTLGVARLLTPFDYAMMTTGMIFLGLADFLADAGLGRALVQKKELQPGDAERAFTLSLGLSALLYGVLCLIAQPAGNLLGLTQFGPFLQVLGLLLLLTPFRSVSVAQMDRNLHLGRQALANVTASVVQSALVLGLALAGHGYWALAVGALAARLLEAILVVWFSGWRPALAWPRGGDGLLGFGVHLSLATLLWFAYTNADYLVIGRLFGPETLGAYALAFQLISLPVQKLTGNVNSVIYPLFCRLQNDPDRLRDWFIRLNVLLGFLGLPTLAGMALVAPDAIPLLLGNRWDESIMPLQLLAGAGAVMLYASTLPTLLVALGRPDVNLRYTVACLVLMTLGFVIGGKTNGLIGVCIAWIVLYPLIVAGLLVLTRPITGAGLLDLIGAQVPILFGVALMIACVLAVRWALPGEETRQPWLRFGVCVLTGAVVYAGFMFLFARRTVLGDLRRLYRQLRGKGEETENGSSVREV